MQHTLEWEYAPEYELLGVSAAVGSHRLAWSMNRAFGWALACGEDLVVHPPKGHESVHPTMRFEPEAEGNKVTVVLNRVPEGVLARGGGALDRRAQQRVALGQGASGQCRKALGRRRFQRR